MSHHLHHPETTKWVVAHDGAGIYHTSKIETQNCFETGQPYMEVFDSKEALLSAFPNLSGTFHDYEPPDLTNLSPLSALTAVPVN